MSKKIFVVSLHRTMTRSTDILLSMLGYRTLHFPKFFSGRNLMEAVRGFEDDPKRVVDELTPVIENRDALSDVPIPGLYEELAERWPDSLFILILRDPMQWARSVRSHMKDRALSPFNHVQYQPYINKQTINKLSEISDPELAAIQDNHEESVRTHFEAERKEPERVCIVDIRDGNAGERISRFLGHDPISLPYLSGRPSQEDLAVCRKWVAACPGKSDAHYFLAKNLHYVGFVKDAENHLWRCIEVEPDQPKPYALLSELLIQKGHLEDAAEVAESALTNGLFRPRLFYRAARGNLRRGKLKRATKLWAKGVRQRWRSH